MELKTLRPFLPALATALLVNTVIAVVLSWQDGSASSFWINALYSHCIGLTIWACLAFAHTRLRLPLWLACLLAIPAGLSFGGLIASRLQGISGRTFGNHLLQQWPVWSGISILALLVNLWASMNRERLARTRAELAQHKAEQAAREREIERTLTQARLSLLQAQLEPHFVFNTLANLRSLIAHEPAAAQALLDRLSVWLRASLKAARSENTTLGAEFALIQAYLDIQVTRMGGRLAYALELPSELAELSLPPMLLQPLIENAIRHGIEPKPGPGRITVAAGREDGQLRLSVSDDGVGFGAADTAGTGVGLANLRERLAALYGEAACLTIESPPAGGVTVTLELGEKR